MRLSVWLTRSFRGSSFLVLALVLSFSQRLLAQQYVVAEASIPFDFVAGATAFVAGDYIIDSSVPSFVVIRSKDGKHSTEVPTVVYDEPVKKSDARLVFVKRNGKYVLHQLWGVLGRRTMTAELANQSVAGMETKEVPLTYPAKSTAGPASAPKSQ